MSGGHKLHIEEPNSIVLPAGRVWHVTFGSYLSCGDVSCGGIPSSLSLGVVICTRPTRENVSTHIEREILSSSRKHTLRLRGARPRPILLSIMPIATAFMQTATATNTPGEGHDASRQHLFDQICCQICCQDNRCRCRPGAVLAGWRTPSRALNCRVSTRQGLTHNHDGRRHCGRLVYNTELPRKMCCLKVKVKVWLGNSQRAASVLELRTSTLPFPTKFLSYLSIQKSHFSFFKKNS